MTESSNPTRLVGFFDILGTSEMVRSGRFGDTIALDFVNAAGLAARFLPTVHVVAFSDSVVIAADVGEVVALLTCVTFVHRQWFADWIVVRGGIATDSLRWAEFDRLERFFSDLPNFR